MKQSKKPLEPVRGLEERILPSLEDLHNLDETYLEVMYPETKRPEDRARGLISYRPSFWFEEDKLEEFIFKEGETRGEAYTRSMRSELEAIGSTLLLLDTAVKPQYTDGTQHYGTTLGTDPGADPLLPLFQEAFGEEANRFNHSYDDLVSKLLPLLRTKIEEALRSKGLPNVPFKVTLIPAALENIEMTTKNPASSTTDTWEWTSTPLLDDEGNDTMHSLSAGYSGNGGAAYLGNDSRSFGSSYGGARLAVVFKKS